jgi:hypothetical protein
VLHPKLDAGRFKAGSRPGKTGSNARKTPITRFMRPKTGGTAPLCVIPKIRRIAANIAAGAKSSIFVGPKVSKQFDALTCQA